MKNPIKTFQPNLQGRDFVAGDLHGSYSVFQNLLKNINFDTTVDRMFLLGDLIDRGPDSLKCLQLLREQWLDSVLANHEQLMLAKFAGGWIGEYWYRNGGTWGIEAYNDWVAMKNKDAHRSVPADSSMELFDLLPLVNELPFLITINTKSGKKFHLLHAELPDSVGTITDKMLADPEKLLELATVQRGDGDAFLWARSIFYQYASANLSNRDKMVRIAKHNHGVKVFNDNLSHIISGHTILHRPMTVVGQTNIDTGAYKSYSNTKDWSGLTCIELDTWKFYHVTSDEFKEVEPVIITKEDIEV